MAVDETIGIGLEVAYDDSGVKKAKKDFNDIEKEAKNLGKGVEAAGKGTGGLVSGLLSVGKSGGGIKGVLGDIGRLGPETAKAAQGFGGLGGSIKGVFSGITGAVGGVIGAVGQLGRNIAGIKQVIGLVGAGVTALTSSGNQFEQFQTQLSVFVGGTDQAKERLKELSDFGAKTPFELPELVAAEKTLLTFIGTSENAVAKTGKNFADLRTVIGDAAASSGAKFEDLSLVIGKFAAGDTGVAIARLQELGLVTKEQLKAVGVEFDKGGALTTPIDEALTKTIGILDTKFAGGAAKLGETFGGQLSTLSDGLETLKRGLTQPIFELFKAGLSEITPILGGLATKATEFGDKFSENFRNSLSSFKDDGFGPIQAAIGAFGDAISTTAPSLKPLGDALQTLGAFADRVAESFGAGGLEGVLKNLPDIFADLGIDPKLADSITNLFKVIKESFADISSATDGLSGKGIAASIVDGISEALPLLISFTAQALKLINIAVENRAAILEFAKAFLIFKTVSTVLGPLTALSGAIAGVLPFLTAAATGTGTLAAIAAKLTPILTTVAGVLGGPITVALGILAAAFAAYKTNFLGFGDLIDGLVAPFKDLDKALTKLTGLDFTSFSGFFASLGDIDFGKLFGGIGDKIASVFSDIDIGGALSDLFGGVDVGSQISDLFAGIDLTDIIGAVLLPVFGIPNLIIQKLTGEGIIDHIKGLFSGIDLADVVLLFLAPVFGIPALILEKLTGVDIAGTIRGLFSGIEIAPPDFIGQLFGGGEAEKEAQARAQSIKLQIDTALADSGNSLTGLAGKFNELGLPPELTSALADLGENISSVPAGTLADKLFEIGKAAQGVGIPPDALEALYDIGSQAVNVSHVAQTAKEDLAKVGSEPIATDGIQGFIDKFSGLDVTSVAQKIGTQLSGLDQYISFDFAKFSSNILDPAALGEAVTTFFADARDSADWSSSFGETLGVSLEESLTSIGVYLDGAALGTAIDDVFAGLAIDTTALDGLLADVGAKFTDAQTAITDALSPVTDAVDGIFGGARDIAAGIQDDIKAKVNEIWLAIPADIRAQLTEIAGLLEEKFEGFKNKIDEKLTAAKERVDEIFAEIAAFFTGHFAEISESVDESTEKIKKFIDDRISEARDIFNDALEDIKKFASEAFADVQKSVEDALATISEKIGKPFRDAYDSVAKSVNDIIAKVKTEFDKIKATVETAVTNAKNAAKARFDEIVSTITTALAPVIEKVRKPFEDAIEAIKTTLARIKAAIYDPIREAVSGIPGAISGALTTISNIGRDIITGIVKGISDTKSAISKALHDSVKAALDSVLSFLRSKSPSRLTHDIVGMPIGQGVAGGITATTDLVIGAALSLAQSAVSALRSVLPFNAGGFFVFDDNGESDKKIQDEIERIKLLKVALKDAGDEASGAAAALAEFTPSLNDAFDKFIATLESGGFDNLQKKLEDLGAVFDEGFFTRAGLIDAKSFEGVRQQIAALADEPERQKELFDALIDGLKESYGSFYDEQIKAQEKLAAAQKKLVADAKKGGGEDTSAQEALDKINDEITRLKDQQSEIDALIDAQTFGIENQFEVYKRLSDIAKDRGQTEEEIAKAIEEAENRIRDVIEARQDQTEQAENDIFDQTMQHIEDAEKAAESAHNQRIFDLEAELQAAKDKIEAETKLNEDFHDAEIERIKARQTALEDELDVRDRQVDLLKSAQDLIDTGQADKLTAEQIKLLADIGVDPNAVKEEQKAIKAANDLLVEQTRVLSEIEELQIRLEDRAKKAGAGPNVSFRRATGVDAAARKVAEEASKTIFEDAIKNGKALDAKQRKLLADAAAGRRVNAAELAAALDQAKKITEEQVKATEEQAKADGVAADPIAKRIAEIQAESAQKKIALEDEKRLNEELLKLEAQRFSDEKDRINTLTGDIEERIAAENRRYDNEKENLEALKALEADRHEERLRQIQEQFALELLSVGKSADEVKKILEQQRKLAKDIADEAARRAAELLQSTATQPGQGPATPPPAAEDPNFVTKPRDSAKTEPVTPVVPPGVGIEPPPGPPPELAVAPVVDQRGVDQFGSALGDSVADSVSDGAQRGIVQGLVDAITASSTQNAALALAKSFAEPTEIALDRLIEKATLLKQVLNGVSGLGPGTGDVTLNRNIVFSGNVTITPEVADRLGLFDVSRVP